MQWLYQAELKHVTCGGWPKIMFMLFWTISLNANKKGMLEQDKMIFWNIQNLTWCQSPDWPNFLHILLSVWRKLPKFAFSWRKQLLLSEQNVPRNISRIVHILLWADESTDGEILSTTTLKLYDSEICSIISCHTKSCTKIKMWIIYSISTWFVWFSIHIFHNF